MSLAIRPLSELNRQPTELLVREMGIADALRCLSQFSSGLWRLHQRTRSMARRSIVTADRVLDQEQEEGTRMTRAAVVASDTAPAGRGAPKYELS